MQMIKIKVEVSGFDSWNNKIQPYIRKTLNTIPYNEHLKIGTNILKDVNTRQIETIVALYEIYNQNFNCNDCQDWGCTKCCSTDDEIRAKQGIFS